MSNVTIEELMKVLADCVVEELNEWLHHCSNEEIAVMLCVAKAWRKATQEINEPAGTDATSARTI